MSDYNYYVGQGLVSIQNKVSGAAGAGDGTWVSIGDADELTINMEQSFLTHNESISGTRGQVLRVPTERAMNFTLNVKNWTPENLKIALLGTLTDNTTSKTVEAFQTTTKEYLIKFEGINMADPDHAVTVEIYRAVLDPTKTLSLIGTTVGTLELSGAILPNSTGKWFKVDIES